MPNAAPCRNVSPAPRHQERAEEEQAIARRQKQIRQTEIDGQPDQEADRPISSSRCRGCPAKQPGGEKARQRADHHGRRHRIARLGRIDHQIDRSKPKHGGQRERGRVARAKQPQQRKAEDDDVRQHVERYHLKPRAETAPAQIRCPADIASPICRRPASRCDRERVCRIVPGRESRSPSALRRDSDRRRGRCWYRGRQAESLEQMRLPQIADVVVDAAAFAPARDRPDVARQHQKATEAAEQSDIFICPCRTRPPQVLFLLLKASRYPGKQPRHDVNARSRSAPCPRALRLSAAGCPRWSPPAARPHRRSRKPRSRDWAPAGDPAENA